MLFLTATPDRQLLNQVQRKTLSISYLPIRYHGHLLPEITIIKTRRLDQAIRQGQLPPKISKTIFKLINEKQRFLLFVPRIIDLKIVRIAIKCAGIVAKYETIFSADPDRIEKVAKMRHRQLDFLITTTILERGVTFPGIDVIVLKADDEIFSAAALVQIAGRVGRNSDRPKGRVLFYCETRTANIKSCDRQIKRMNQRARQL